MAAIILDTSIRLGRGRGEEDDIRLEVRIMEDRKRCWLEVEDADLAAVHHSPDAEARTC